MPFNFQVDEYMITKFKNTTNKEIDIKLAVTPLSPSSNTNFCLKTNHNGRNGTSNITPKSKPFCHLNLHQFKSKVQFNQQKQNPLLLLKDRKLAQAVKITPLIQEVKSILEILIKEEILTIRYI